MIFLYGIPTVVVQGLIFFGFIYVVAKIIEFVGKNQKDKRQEIQKRIEKSTENSNAIKSKAPNTSNHTKPYIPKYSLILKIISAVTKDSIEGKYLLIGIKSIQWDEIEVPLDEIIVNSRIWKLDNIEEDTESYWVLTIEGTDFDINKLKFYCLYKDEVCNELSIYSASEVNYRGKIYTLERIKDVKIIDAYKTAIAFNNWVNTSGLNNKRLSRLTLPFT